MQQQYMDTWMKFTPQATPWGATASPFAATGSNPWTNSFEQWSKLFGQGMPQNAQEVSTRLFDLGKSYLGMSEGFWKLLQQNQGSSLCATDWQETMKNSLGQMSKSFNFPDGATDPWSGFATLWGLPLSNWQRMACSFSPFPGEMEKALREERAPHPSDMTRAIRHYLSVPSVGYTREWQDQAQEWSRLSIEYAHTMQDFSALLGKVVQRALELFGTRVAEKLKAGESFDGLRSIYNLWIDSGEDAYAEQVDTADFPHLQAELVNALMRMKRHEQGIMEEFMTALNMPTRQELDTTHQRVYELQKQLRELQDTLEEAAEAESAPPAPAKTRKAAPGKTGSTAKRRTQTKTRKG
jgi:class III poly(R)-hydroxyalkanoic acid synthase PhaE subunit